MWRARSAAKCGMGWQAVGTGHMIAEAWHGMAEASCGAMMRWADGAWLAPLHGPKGTNHREKGLPKGAKWAMKAFSFPGLFYQCFQRKC